MCRHRRLAHQSPKVLDRNEDSQSSVQSSSTSSHDPQPDIDPQTFYFVNVAGNIAENLYSHLDGKQTALDNPFKFIKAFKPENKVVPIAEQQEPQKLVWKKYNFPTGYAPPEFRTENKLPREEEEQQEEETKVKPRSNEPPPLQRFDQLGKASVLRVPEVRRCGLCRALFRNLEDYADHMQQKHRKSPSEVYPPPPPLTKMTEETASIVTNEPPGGSTDVSNDSTAAVPESHLSQLEEEELFSQEWKHYVCMVCKKEFDDLSYLYKHQYRKHPRIVCTHMEIDDRSSTIVPLLKAAPSPYGLLNQPPIVPAPCASQTFKCTKCCTNFSTLSRLHSHILACATPLPVKAEMAAAKKGATKKGLKLTRPEANPEKAQAAREKQKLALKVKKKNMMQLKRKRNLKEKMAAAALSIPQTRQTRKRGFELLYVPGKHKRRRELTELVNMQQCRGCGLTFSTISALERHVKKCSNQEKIKLVQPLKPSSQSTPSKWKNPQLQCKFCLKQFTYPGGLGRHIREICHIRKTLIDSGDIDEQDGLEGLPLSEPNTPHKQAKSSSTNSSRSLLSKVKARGRLLLKGKKRKGRKKNWTLVKKRLSSKDAESAIIPNEVKRLSVRSTPTKEVLKTGLRSSPKVDGSVNSLVTPKKANAATPKGKAQASSTPRGKTSATPKGKGLSTPQKGLANTPKGKLSTGKKKPGSSTKDQNSHTPTVKLAAVAVTDIAVTPKKKVNSASKGRQGAITPKGGKAVQTPKKELAITPAKKSTPKGKAASTSKQKKVAIKEEADIATAENSGAISQGKVSTSKGKVSSSTPKGKVSTPKGKASTPKGKVSTLEGMGVSTPNEKGTSPQLDKAGGSSKKEKLLPNTPGGKKSTTAKASGSGRKALTRGQREEGAEINIDSAKKGQSVKLRGALRSLEFPSEDIETSVESSGKAKPTKKAGQKTSPERKPEVAKKAGKARNATPNKKSNVSSLNDSIASKDDDATDLSKATPSKIDSSENKNKNESSAEKSKPVKSSPSKSLSAKKRLAKKFSPVKVARRTPQRLSASRAAAVIGTAVALEAFLSEEEDIILMKKVIKRRKVQKSLFSDKNAAKTKSLDTVKTKSLDAGAKQVPDQKGKLKTKVVKKKRKLAKSTPQGVGTGNDLEDGAEVSPAKKVKGETSGDMSVNSKKQDQPKKSPPKKSLAKQKYQDGLARTINLVRKSLQMNSGEGGDGSDEIGESQGEKKSPGLMKKKGQRSPKEDSESGSPSVKLTRQQRQVSGLTLDEIEAVGDSGGAEDAKPVKNKVAKGKKKLKKVNSEKKLKKGAGECFGSEGEKLTTPQKKTPKKKSKTLEGTTPRKTPTSKKAGAPIDSEASGSSTGDIASSLCMDMLCNDSLTPSKKVGKSAKANSSKKRKLEDENDLTQSDSADIANVTSSEKKKKKKLLSVSDALAPSLKTPTKKTVATKSPKIGKKAKTELTSAKKVLLNGEGQVREAGRLEGCVRDNPVVVLVDSLDLKTSPHQASAAAAAGKGKLETVATGARVSPANQRSPKVLYESEAGGSVLKAMLLEGKASGAKLCAEDAEQDDDDDGAWSDDSDVPLIRFVTPKKSPTKQLCSTSAARTPGGSPSPSAKGKRISPPKNQPMQNGLSNRGPGMNNDLLSNDVLSGEGSGKTPSPSQKSKKRESVPKTSAKTTPPKVTSENGFVEKSPKKATKAASPTTKGKAKAQKSELKGEYLDNNMAVEGEGISKIHKMLDSLQNPQPASATSTL